MKDMVEAINPNNKQFFAVPQMLTHLSEKIQEVAQNLISSSDPYIIETPYIQRTGKYFK
jgi:Holliday junction resolvasome RuvABC ATP-dependent DNA helicase subunit